MADIVATYAVHAGTTVTIDLDDVTDPDLVALYLIEDSGELADVSVCHQCAHSVVDPEVDDLVAFTINGVTYEKDEETGHWVPTGGVPADVPVDKKPAFRITIADRFGGAPR